MGGAFLESRAERPPALRIPPFREDGQAGARRNSPFSDGCGGGWRGKSRVGSGDAAGPPVRGHASRLTSQSHGLQRLPIRLRRGQEVTKSPLDRRTPLSLGGALRRSPLVQLFEDVARSLARDGCPLIETA